MKKRKIISIFLVLLMLATMLPSLTLTASATGESVSDDTALQSALTQAGNNGGTVIMTEDIICDDVTLTLAVASGKTVVLDGGGHKLTGLSGAVTSGTALSVDGSGTLILKNINFQGGNVSSGGGDSCGLATYSTFSGVIAVWGYANAIGGSCYSDSSPCYGLSANGNGGRINLTSATGGGPTGTSRGVAAAPNNKPLYVYVGTATAGNPTNGIRSGVFAYGSQTIVNVGTSTAAAGGTGSYGVMANGGATVNVGTASGATADAMNNGSVYARTLANGTSAGSTAVDTDNTKSVTLHKLQETDTCVLSNLTISSIFNMMSGPLPSVVDKDGNVMAWFTDEARTIPYTGNVTGYKTDALYAGYTTPPSSPVTINTTVNGTAADVSGSIELRQGGAVKYTAVKSSLGVYTFSAANGTYDVFVSGIDTDSNITVNSAATTMTASLYTVDITAETAGDASDSSISATVDGTKITNGTAVPAGKAVAITAEGTGATYYNYLWSGTGTNGETSETLNISSLSGEVNAKCTVTGTYVNPVVTAANSDELAAALANLYISTINLTAGSVYDYDGATVTRAVTINGNGATINIGTGIDGTLVKRHGDTPETSVGDTVGKVFLAVGGASGSLTMNNVTLKNGETLLLCGIQVRDHANLTLNHVSFENFYANPTTGGTVNNFGVHADPDAAAVTIDDCAFGDSNSFRNAVAIRGGTAVIKDSTFAGTANPERLNSSDGFEYGIYLYGGTSTITGNSMSGFGSGFFPGYLSSPIATAAYFDITATITGNMLTGNMTGLNLVGSWYTLSAPARATVNGIELDNSEHAYALGEALMAANTFSGNTEGNIQLNIDQNDFYTDSSVTPGKDYGMPAYFGGFLTLAEKSESTVSVIFNNGESAKAAIANQKAFLIQTSTDNGVTWTTSSTEQALTSASTGAVVTGLEAGTPYLLRAVLTINCDTMPARDLEVTADIVCYSGAVSVTTVGQLDAPSAPIWNGASAVWSAVPYAVGYSAQIYKDGTPLGSPVTVSGTACSFASVMTSPLSSYTVKVTALGDDTNYKSSAASSAGMPATFFLINYQSDSDSYTTQVVIQGSKTTAPVAPRKSGYTFGGWYKDSICTDGNAWNFSTDPVTAVTTLYAKWTESASATYAVNYYANGADVGKVPSDRNQYALNAPVRVKGNIGGLAKTGYTFGGWSNGSATYAEGQTFSILGDMILTAVWTPAAATQTVKYSYNYSGTGLYTTQTNINSGAALTAPESPVRSGYVFTGWYKDTSCMRPWNFSADTISTTTTLYAGWAANTYSVRGTVKDTDTDIGASGTNVSLYQGSVHIDSTTTDHNGEYSFVSVPNGIYSLIVTGSEGQQTTVGVVVSGGAIDMSVVYLPSGRKSTLLSIQGTNTPPVAASGMNRLLSDEGEGGAMTAADAAAVIGGGAVSILLEVQPVTNTHGQAKVNAAMSSGGYAAGALMDIDLTKITTTSNGQQSETVIDETNSPLEIIIPLPAALQGKNSYAVYRAHDYGGSIGMRADTITAIPVDGEYAVVSSDKTYLTLHVKYFSTYAIAYNIGSTDTTTSTSIYSITVPTNMTGGSISPSGIVRVTGGDSKSFTITPDKGYIISDVLVDGKSVGAVSNYIFSNIVSAHTITAVFAKASGLPYYLDASGDKLFIGFSSDAGGTIKYIAPNGMTVHLTPNPKSFTDMTTHWAKGSIDFVTQREIFVGTGANTFSPDAGMTRAMLATVIGKLYERSYGKLSTTGIHAFTDCDYNGWYGSYIDWCSENGIITGVGSGKFEPNRQVTRQEVGVMLYRFAQFMKLDTATDGKTLSYTDASSISSWAQAAALYCQETGIINGRLDGNFVPKATATRAEVATILERFIEMVV